jgi:hypothetical protein
MRILLLSQKNGRKWRPEYSTVMRLTTVAPAMTPSASYKFLAGFFQELPLLFKAKITYEARLSPLAG